MCLQNESYCVIFDAMIAPNKSRPAQPNQSLIHGIGCLQTVIASSAPIGSREVSRRLGMEHTRVNRHLKTFVSLGILQQMVDKSYVPGPGIHVLAAQSLRASGLLKAALPVIRNLVQGELSVALGVLWEKNVCYLYHGKPGIHFDAGISSMDLFPAERSSIGMILSAPSKDEFAFNNEGNGKGSVAVRVGNPALAGLAFAGNIVESDLSQLVSILQKAAEDILYDMNTIK
jgi:hypothetical protein